MRPLFALAFFLVIPTFSGSTLDGCKVMDLGPDVDDDGDGFTEDDGDCNDSNSDAYPGAREVCDRRDNDCDSLVDDADEDVDPSGLTQMYRDMDGDGYGDDAYPTILACEPGLTDVSNNDDCNDADEYISPAADEVCYDGVDNDCVASTHDDC